MIVLNEQISISQINGKPIIRYSGQINCESISFPASNCHVSKVKMEIEEKCYHYLLFLFKIVFKTRIIIIVFSLKCINVIYFSTLTQKKGKYVQVEIIK
jgi:hypothetical protein